VLVELTTQGLLAGGFYAALVLMIRLAGKRLAGQTSTLDLVVLIGLAVVLQNSFLRPGPSNAAVFVAVVFSAHRGLSWLCRRAPWVRRLVHGKARPLIRDGAVQEEALDDENLSHDDLLAGLRKLGLADPSEVRLAVLEETGHISAIPMHPK
jgi:uncharacterized membrane protein YcaP (DUF421 family)